MRPAPLNEHYLATVNEPLTSAELAKFNIEINTHPLAINCTVFNQLHQQLQTTWENADSHAKSLQSALIIIGILPTLHPSDLTIKNMSDLNRYRALKEQILATQHEPIHLDITGEEHLDLYHNDIMLKPATTSLQLHTKVPPALRTIFIMHRLLLLPRWWPFVVTPRSYLVKTCGMNLVFPYLNKRLILAATMVQLRAP